MGEGPLFFILVFHFLFLPQIYSSHKLKFPLFPFLHLIFSPCWSRGLKSAFLDVGSGNHSQKLLPGGRRGCQGEGASV
jgi:hypothetical protein